MIWLTATVIAVTAALTMGFLVPRLRVDDPEAPDFGQLASAPWVAGTAVAAFLAAQVLWALPVQAWPLWTPYLALGVPVIVVDLRTTFLPRTATRLVAVAMAIGLVPLAALDWRAAAGAVVGGAAAFCFMYAAYRLSHSLGYGDVRLAALVGAVAGQDGLSSWAGALFAGTLLGALHGIGHAVWRARAADRPGHYPYGPALWLGPVVGAAAATIGW